MLPIITALFVLIYTTDIFLLFLFGLHSLLMVYLYRKNHKYCISDPERNYTLEQEASLPHVTVQLPIFNEYYVVDRLIDSVIALDYPKSKLEIQILDDSTDETVEKALQIAEFYRAKGFDIVHLHRKDRTGHKAGALEKGMEVAKGEFIAIFDADFIPDPDFLLKSLPYFEDREIGMVQARWGHINQNYNMLTKAQGYGIDGHFMIEQVARNSNHLWMNFNGTAGIWRKETIIDAGGWEHDTLTEDFDLSYRAELKGWKFRYFKDIVCKAEIPAMISAYKSQQFRWCKGSIQTGVKLLPRIWKHNLPWQVKGEAIIHLINYSVAPLMVINILFTAPLLLMEFWSGWGIKDIPITILFVTATFLSIGSIGPIVFYAYSQREIYPDWKSRLSFLPVMIMIGTGVSIVNTRAWLEAVLGIKSGFKRTPKLRIENSSDSLKDRQKYPIPFDANSILELAMAIYCFFCVYLSFLVDKPFIIGFLFIYGMGFLFVSLNTIKESLWKLQGAFEKEKEAVSEIA
ncbi:MAG: glycosyltransferase [Leptospiraceae bacterium]|nr:glycosyltransferase family 2 protein [Leptospiraceae bacterium]MCP5513780.1 glycosyltransferase [Leptospiraceae bacterium]